AKDEHTLKAFLEAEAYDGPSIIIAYSHYIAHGINMTTAMSDQKFAVDSGQWLLYRYNPERTSQGENPLLLDSRTPTRNVKEYLQQRPASRCSRRASRKMRADCGNRPSTTPRCAIGSMNIWHSVSSTRVRKKNRKRNRRKRPRPRRYRQTETSTLCDRSRRARRQESHDRPHNHLSRIETTHPPGLFGLPARPGSLGCAQPGRRRRLGHCAAFLIRRAVT